MTMSELSAGQIRRSIQRFDDYASDLAASGASTVTDRLNMFIEFCRSDPTISRVHQQLLGVSGVDLNGWLRDAGAKREVVFPTDIEQRLSLMYQILLAVHAGKIDILNFVAKFMALGSSSMDDYVYAFSHAVIHPLVRELRYRLDDIHLPPENTERVRASVIQVITNTGTLVQQVAPHAGQATMNATLDQAHLLTLTQALRDAVVRADLGPSERQSAIDVANAVAEEAASRTPRISVLKGLLAALPRVADVAQIVSTITTLLQGQS